MLSFLWLKPFQPNKISDAFHIFPNFGTLYMSYRSQNHICTSYETDNHFVENKKTMSQNKTKIPDWTPTTDSPSTNLSQSFNQSPCTTVSSTIQKMHSQPSTPISFVKNSYSFEDRQAPITSKQPITSTDYCHKIKTEQNIIFKTNPKWSQSKDK